MKNKGIGYVRYAISLHGGLVICAKEFERELCEFLNRRFPNRELDSDIEVEIEEMTSSKQVQVK